MGIGQRLKRLRTQRNPTQEALSELTGRKVSQGAIAALESRDSESSRFVPDLAAALKVAPSALLSDTTIVIDKLKTTVLKCAPAVRTTTTQEPPS